MAFFPLAEYRSIPDGLPVRARSATTRSGSNPRTACATLAQGGRAMGQCVRKLQPDGGASREECDHSCRRPHIVAWTLDRHPGRA